MDTTHWVRLHGELFARGVACTLISAGQAFEFRTLDRAAGIFEVGVTEEGRRFLPVGCRSRTRADGDQDS